MTQTYHSYEDMAWVSSRPKVHEGWSPQALGAWAEGISAKLKQMLDKAEAEKQFDDLAKLNRFKIIWDKEWDKNAQNGNLNVETFEKLYDLSKLEAENKWPHASYFQGLATSLNQLRIWQSTENTMPEQPDANMDMVGGAGASTPPLNPDFGPQEKEPGAGAPGEEKPPGEELPGEPAPGEGGPGGGAPAGRPTRPMRPGAPEVPPLP